MSKEFLFAGYSIEDQRRAETTLDKLVPNMTGPNWWLVGGLAIRHHLAKNQRELPQRGLNDIDIVATSPDDISPDIADSFLIHHSHPLKPDGHFRFVLADPETRIKVDVFPRNPKNPTLDRVEYVEYKGMQLLPLQTAEDQLAKTVLDLVMMWGRPVDPKQLDDAARLLRVVDTRKTNEIYRDLQDRHTTVEEALDHVHARRASNPETFAAKPWQSEETYDCDQCVDDPRFPVSSMEEVVDVLGYVELN